jgi:hypothetical protein
MKIRTHSELIELPTFEERFEYLQLNGKVAEETFGYDRYLNQIFYNSGEWKQIRRDVILRDNGLDLGCDDKIIGGKIYVHHMNPILLKDIETRSADILNPEFLISCSFDTHNAIHYGDITLLPDYEIVERRPNDTIPWK